MDNPFKGGLGDLMKKAQEMQSSMQDAQKQLADLTVVGESGAGMVKITMTGRYDVKAVDIADSCIDLDGKEILQDLIAAAIRDAIRKIEKESRDRMSSLTSGLNLPADFKLPTDQ